MHLMSQIKYKLSDYDSSMGIYTAILDKDAKEGVPADQIQQEDGAEGKLEADEIMDIITNYLACQSSIGHSSIEEIQGLLQNYCNGDTYEKTYEFFFNMS